jgi:hypothetical protein
VKAIYTDGVQAIDLARRQGCAPKTISNKLSSVKVFAFFALINKNTMKY